MLNNVFKRNPNPNPNLNPYPTLNQKPNHYPHSNSLLSEILLQEKVWPEQMLDHPDDMFKSEVYILWCKQQKEKLLNVWYHLSSKI